MAVLPTPGGDVGIWGPEIIAWLLTAHNADGTLKAGALPETAAGAPVAGTFAAGDVNVDRTGQVWVCVVAGTPGTWTCATKSRQQLAQAAAGLVTESGDLATYTVLTAPVSQTVYGRLLGLKAGDVISGVLLRNALSAVGVAPTTVRAGLADSTGQILVLSGNLNAAASWPVNAVPLAFTAPYTVLADGGYFACFVVNGAWGTTQPTPFRGLSTGAAVAFGANAPPAFAWAGQADLPAIGAALTKTASGLLYYMALY